MGQVRKTVIFLGFVAVAYALYLVFTGQVDEFVSSLAGVDMSWIVAGVICALALDKFNSRFPKED